MTKSKRISFVNYIIIDNKCIPMDSLDKVTRDAISIRLNDIAMQSIGYKRVDKTA